MIDIKEVKMNLKINFAIATVALASCAASFAQQTVVGAPKTVASGSSATESQLVYRDPAKPLTIGEMADKQAAEATEKFLNKHGFTGVKPVEQASAQVNKPVIPPNRLRLLAMYGTPGSLTAELSLNNATHLVKGPQALGGIQVIQVGAKGVTVALPSKQRCKWPSSKKGTNCLPANHQLAVGDLIEWRK